MRNDVSMRNRRAARPRQTGMHRAAVVITVAALALSAFGCGDDEAAVRSDGTSTPGRGQLDAARYRGSGTVLESADHGPELCDGAAASLPPQCSGVPLIGWDWAAVDGEQSVEGTTWGEWEVTGTWDGRALTLTETPQRPRQYRDEGGPGLKSPCPEPPGGWEPVDPGMVNVGAQEAAMRVADQLPDVAGTWVDQSINPALADGYDPGDEAVANNPALLVINVQVTEDPARAETSIREVWGGPLCVSTVKHTMAELRTVQDQLWEQLGLEPPGVSSGGVDVSRNQVLVTVYVATPELIEDLDRRFGDAIAVTGLLEPLE